MVYYLVYQEPKLDDFMFNDFRHVAISNLRNAGSIPDAHFKKGQLRRIVHKLTKMPKMPFLEKVPS